MFVRECLRELDGLKVAREADERTAMESFKEFQKLATERSEDTSDRCKEGQRKRARLSAKLNLTVGTAA